MTNQEAQLVNTAGILSGLQNSAHNNKHPLSHTSAINNRIFTERKNIPTFCFFSIAGSFFSPLRSLFSPRSLAPTDWPAFPSRWGLGIGITVNVSAVTVMLWLNSPWATILVAPFPALFFLPGELSLKGHPTTKHAPERPGSHALGSFSHQGLGRWKHVRPSVFPCKSDDRNAPVCCKSIKRGKAAP